LETRRKKFQEKKLESTKNFKIFFCVIKKNIHPKKIKKRIQKKIVEKFLQKKMEARGGGGSGRLPAAAGPPAT